MPQFGGGSQLDGGETRFEGQGPQFSPRSDGRGGGDRGREIHYESEGSGLWGHHPEGSRQGYVAHGGRGGRVGPGRDNFVGRQ